MRRSAVPRYHDLLCSPVNSPAMMASTLAVHRSPLLTTIRGCAALAALLSTLMRASLEATQPYSRFSRSDLFVSPNRLRLARPTATRRTTSRRGSTKRHSIGEYVLLLLLRRRRGLQRRDWARSCVGNSRQGAGNRRTHVQGLEVLHQSRRELRAGQQRQQPRRVAGSFRSTRCSCRLLESTRLLTLTSLLAAIVALYKLSTLRGHTSRERRRPAVAIPSKPVASSFARNDLRSVWPAGGERGVQLPVQRLQQAMR